jgi:hypothetical protein
MKVYRSKIFECPHEDFKTHLEFGGISQADMDEFEKDCFKEIPVQKKRGVEPLFLLYTN